MELIDDLWRKYNVSMILVLPLFKDIIENIKIKGSYKLNIQGIFYDAGMINTFLLDENHKYNGNLRIVFNHDSILNYKLYDQNGNEIASLMELLISSEYFKDVKIIDSYLIISLKINEKWNKDIKQIIKSKYTEVSADYKEYVKYKGIYLKHKNKTINYLYLSNIPAKILLKHSTLEVLIQQLFNVPKLELTEIYKAFSKSEESFNEDSLLNITNKII